MNESLFLAIACIVISFYILLLSVALRPLGFTGGAASMVFSVTILFVGIAALRSYLK